MTLAVFFLTCHKNFKIAKKKLKLKKRGILCNLSQLMLGLSVEFSWVLGVMPITPINLAVNLVF
jgi:hypothetical protein